MQSAHKACDFSFSFMTLHQLVLIMKTINVSIDICDLGPGIAWYRIETKCCVSPTPNSQISLSLSMLPVLVIDVILSLNCALVFHLIN